MKGKDSDTARLGKFHGDLLPQRGVPLWKCAVDIKYPGKWIQKFVSK